MDLKGYTAPGSIKKVVVLGHNGFIGSYLMPLFRQCSPELEVIGRALPELDLTKSEEAEGLSELFDCRTAVVMCSGIKKQLGDSLEIFSQNMALAVNVAKVLEKHPVSRFIYFSSAEVYGAEINNTQISEGTAKNPDSFYGAAKYVSECLLRKVFAGHKQSSLVILRPPLVYGPGDNSKSYGPAGFIEQALKHREITLWGDGSEYRDLIFVEDLARIVVSMVFSDYDGVLNCATGISHTFKEMLEIVKGLFPFEIKVNERARTKEKVDNKFSNKLLRQVVPDIVFTSLQDGIRRIFEHESSRLNALSRSVLTK